MTRKFLGLVVLATMAGGCKKMSADYAGAPMMPVAGYGMTAASPSHGGESYAGVDENPVIAVADDARSTFAVDVDTASYSNVRRFLREGSAPPADAVRIEELVNYFDYDYQEPTGTTPFSVTSEVGPCPWNPEHELVHLGLQGKHLAAAAVPPRNLVFLLDVSGSMQDPDKLPLLQRAMALVTENLRPADHVAIVVYAGASGVVLEPTSGLAKSDILEAVLRLEAGGSTNGGEGIELAYRMAERHFNAKGINRVILATDGDFNVGITDHKDLVRLIEAKRQGGVFLSVLGFGSGNLQDSTMESLADKGNGNYAYIDSLAEARKVLVTEAGSTLVTIAKDVKLQVEFNPLEVASFRLIGYENRLLEHSDFNDDAKDAGEIGAGHSVTAIYEIARIGHGADPKVDPHKYQRDDSTTAAARSGELMTVKIRYKQPDGSDSALLSFPVHGEAGGLAQTSQDFRFSAAVAEFGMLLRDSAHRGNANWADTRKLATGALGEDPDGLRREFLAMLDAAAGLAGAPIAVAKD